MSAAVEAAIAARRAAKVAEAAPAKKARKGKAKAETATGPSDAAAGQESTTKAAPEDA